MQSLFRISIKLLARDYVGSWKRQHDNATILCSIHSNITLRCIVQNCSKSTNCSTNYNDKYTTNGTSITWDYSRIINGTYNGDRMISWSSGMIWVKGKESVVFHK